MLSFFAFCSDFNSLPASIPYQKRQSTMKTSSIITILAFAFLSFFVAPSHSKGKGMSGKGMSGKGMNSEKKSKKKKKTTTTTATASRPQTCAETCQRIARKPPLIPCTLDSCIGYFDCANLPFSSGFKNQQQCISYCASFVLFSCPQVIGSTNNPTTRCLEARCT
jgi:hypothetical protein